MARRLWPRRGHVAALAIATALAGCVTMDDLTQKTTEQTAEARRGQKAAPFRTITGFSPALRCMDNLMIDYGVRDISTLVEELGDQTKKINAGTRDMLITALSDMTRRSRALRVVAFGRDTPHAAAFMEAAQRKSAFDAVPQFDIKGSVTQFDESVIRNRSDGAIGLQPFFNVGYSRDAASSIMALDLSMLNTGDFSLLPGVTSRNSVVLMKEGHGRDGDAAIHKFGINYSLNFSRSEGPTQALRGLVELAAIELMGKLTKIPYWICLDSTAGGSDEIKAEIADWFHAMASSRVEIIGYFQHQLRRRGFYEGPVDGVFNPAIDEAIKAYRVQLGLSDQALLDEAFFVAFLSADHSRIGRPAEPARFVPSAAGGGGPGSASARQLPLKAMLSTPKGQTRFAAGEAVRLHLKVSQDVHAYCYLQTDGGQVMRIFPNRFSKDSLVPAARPMVILDPARFKVALTGKESKATASCFATARDPAARLPREAIGGDFEVLKVNGLEPIRAAFIEASNNQLAQGVIHLESR